MNNACYNPLLPEKFSIFMRPSRQLLLAFTCALLLIFPAICAGQNFASPAREFVSKILVHAETHSAVSLAVRNVSSLTQNEAAEVRRQLESQLRSAGVRLVKADQATEEVRVTLSENTQEYLWVASIGKGESQQVVMQSVARPEGVAVPSSSTMVIRKTLLRAHAVPFLDLAPLDAPGGVPRLLMLEPERIVMFREMLNVGSEERAAVTHSRPWPRDLHARLVVAADHTFQAYYPGVRCSGSIDQLSTTRCQDVDDPWPLGAGQSAFFNAARNFFTGTFAPGIGGVTKIPPFFSAASVSLPGGATAWIFAGIDGQAQLYDKAGPPSATFNNWGSEIAGVRSSCGTGSQVLVTAPGDRAQLDHVQAYEIVNHEATAAGAPVEFGGPVLALWTAPDGNSATAITHNLQTGFYEAFTLSIACGR